MNSWTVLSSLSFNVYLIFGLSVPWKSWEGYSKSNNNKRLKRTMKTPLRLMLPLKAFNLHIIDMWTPLMNHGTQVSYSLSIQAQHKYTCTTQKNTCDIHACIKLTVKREFNGGLDIWRPYTELVWEDTQATSIQIYLYPDWLSIKLDCWIKMQISMPVMWNYTRLHYSAEETLWFSGLPQCNDPGVSGHSLQSLHVQS